MKIAFWFSPEKGHFSGFCKYGSTIMFDDSQIVDILECVTWGDAMRHASYLSGDLFDIEKWIEEDDFSLPGKRSMTRW